MGSWQHLDLNKPRAAPVNEPEGNATSGENSESVASNDNQPSQDQGEEVKEIDRSEFVIDRGDFVIQTLSSYPPAPSDQPTNDYFLAQHSYNNDIPVHEINAGSVDSQPPLPPPEEDHEVSEHYDLLLGFGLNETAAKQIDLLFTCKYLSEPLPDEVIVELAELEDGQISALVDNFRTSDLSKIRNRLVFFKARLKLLKMKGVGGLTKASAASSSTNRPPSSNPAEAANTTNDANEFRIHSASDSGDVKPLKQAGANSGQAQTYTYMAMQRLANYDKASSGSASNPNYQQQGSQQSASGQESGSSDPYAAGSNNVASNPYNYPNPYQDMSSVQQNPQQAANTQNSAYSNNAYQGYNQQNYQNYYAGSYNASYGWGNTATPGAFGQNRQGYSNGYAGSNQASNVPAFSAPSLRSGPDMSKMNEILLRTGYNYEHNHVIRKYGPPPDWVGDPPGSGHELFVGKIPTDCWEDEIIPVFEQAGKIYEVKILIDKETNMNKGFCFVCMCTKEEAKNAITRFNGYYLRQRCRIFVKYSVQFTRLFVGGIPRNKTREEIFSGFHDEVHNLADVEVGWLVLALKKIFWLFRIFERNGI